MKRPTATTISAVLALLTGVAVLGAASAASATPRPRTAAGSQDFTFTGAPVDWTVPADVYSIVATVCGASGENMMIGGSQVKFAGRPGRGGCVTAKVAVTPGALIRVRVGGAATTGAGGWPDGGTMNCPSVTCGGSGGGSSDIRIGGDALSNRVLVGGGGGGGGGDSLGGSGGDGGNGTFAFNGEDGSTGGGLPDNPNHPRGGIGGTLTQETRGCGVQNRTTVVVPECVTGQHIDWAYAPGRPGTANVGGDSAGVFSGAIGGAGGGGWFGGGSGCSWNSNYDAVQSNGLAACGGGGGSSYADPARTTEHALFRGTATWYDTWLGGGDTHGDPGTVSISWADSPDPGVLPPTGSSNGVALLAVAVLSAGALLAVSSRRRVA